MADAAAAPVAAPSLSDFFSKKGNKKSKANNLNKDTTTAKPDDKKPKKKDEDNEWVDEDTVVVNTLNVQVAGNLAAAAKNEEEEQGRHWGAVKKGDTSGNNLNNQKFPTLERSMHHKHAVGLAMDDGPRRGQLSTAKNHFSAFAGEQDSDEEDKPRAKPTLAKKQKGEMEKTVKAQEVPEKTKSGEKKSKKKDKAEEDSEGEKASEDESEEEKPAPKKAEKVRKPAAKEESKDDDEALDLQIKLDDEAAKAKYKGRTKLVKKEIPRDDLEEEKENRGPKKMAGGAGLGKKKFAVFEEEKKLEYVEE